MEQNVAIETRGLTRRFGNIKAVDGLSINVPSRSVYGFLGPNGAGKTTTIRMLLGLVRPDDGEAYLFGAPLVGNEKNVLRQVGSLIESPSLYPHLTGRENLEVSRRLLNAPRTSIDRVLAIVDLEKDSQRIVRGYSQGMKQRLGLALAMLNEPLLLILDEPTNGLDPAGIHEMRDLIISLPEEYGVTVFLSSHLLSEIEQTATHIGIITSGHLLFQGTLDQLQEQCHPQLLLEVDYPKAAIDILAKAGWNSTLKYGLQLWVNSKTYEDAAEVNNMLVRSGVNVSHLSYKRLSLEDIFLNLTKRVAETEGISE